MTRKHDHEEIFAASPERLFRLLHTPSAIRDWWGASQAIVQPEPGGTWCAAWGDEDDPDYITSAVMGIFDPPKRIVFSEYRYFAKDGTLPFKAEFTVEFTVRSHPEGAVLRVVQDGFPTTPEADDFYAACEQGWLDTFAGIRRYLQHA